MGKQALLIFAVMSRMFVKEKDGNVLRIPLGGAWPTNLNSRDEAIDKDAYQADWRLV